MSSSSQLPGSYSPLQNEPDLMNSAEDSTNVKTPLNPSDLTDFAKIKSKGGIALGSDHELNASDFEMDMDIEPPKKTFKDWFTKPKSKKTIAAFSLLVILPLLFLLFLLKTRKHKVDVVDTKHNSKLPSADSIIKSTASWRLDTNVEYNITNWSTTSNPKTGQLREYTWEITDQEIAPDGLVRSMTLINGQFPGPMVQANVGDTLRVHVINKSQYLTSIHFHGLFFSDATAYYDGAVGLTQCAGINANGGEFVYEFEILQSGTYWYHSHYGTQAADGIIGPVVLHDAAEDDLVKDSYDEDLVVLVGDHYHKRGDTYLAEYLGPGNENDEPTPDNGLIQGANTFGMPDITPEEGETEDNEDEATKYYKGTTFNSDDSRHHTFILAPDRRYRLRVINVAFFSEIDFTIDEHPMTVIEADGTLVKPLDPIDVLSIAAAQRYSVIITTDKYKEDTATEKHENLFWMHAKLNPYCFADGKSWLNIDTRALVVYDSNPVGNYVSKSLSLSTIDADSVEYQYTRDIFCRELDESLLHPLISDPAPANFDSHYRLDAWFNIGAYTLDRGKFNDTSFVPLSDSSVMYKQAFELPADDPTLTTDGPHVPYPSNFVINVNNNGTVVDVLINNLDDGAHPFHLHGHKFWVLAVGSGNFHFDQYDDQINTAPHDMFMKRDTIQVQGYKWALIRFVADNPGVWVFHCHIGWHLESGLAMSFNVMPSVYREWDHWPEDWKAACKS